MKITKRATDGKRHTLGFLAGGKWRTRKQAVRLAREGRISGVSVIRGRDGDYIKAQNDRVKLYSLPTTQDRVIRRGSLVSR